MQEPGDFLDRHPEFNLESPTMSAYPSIILVVEDDAIVRMLIVDVLEELEFKVLEADGSEKARRFKRLIRMTRRADSRALKSVVA